MQEIVNGAYNRKQVARERLRKAHEHSTFQEFNDAGREWSQAFDNWLEVSKQYPDFVKKKPTELEEAAAKYVAANEGSIKDFMAGVNYILNKYKIESYSSSDSELIPKNK